MRCALRLNPLYVTETGNRSGSDRPCRESSCRLQLASAGGGAFATVCCDVRLAWRPAICRGETPTHNQEASRTGDVRLFETDINQQLAHVLGRNSDGNADLYVPFAKTLGPSRNGQHEVAAGPYQCDPVTVSAASSRLRCSSTSKAHTMS